MQWITSLSLHAAFAWFQHLVDDCIVSQQLNTLTCWKHAYPLRYFLWAKAGVAMRAIIIKLYQLWCQPCTIIIINAGSSLLPTEGEEGEEELTYSLAEGEFLATTFVFLYEEAVLPSIKWFFNGHSDENELQSYNFAFGYLQLINQGAYTASMMLYNPTVLEEGFVEGQLFIHTEDKLELSGCSRSSYDYWDLVYALNLNIIPLEAAVVQIKRYGKLFSF